MRMRVKQAAARSSRILGMASALAVIASASCSPSDAPAPPGSASDGVDPERARIILLISIDTLRADHLGLYGYERFTSPVLDTISLEGVVFEDASATSPWTLPSHASILTGLYPLQHGVRTMKTALPPEVHTLASMLARHGFETAAVVNSTWLKKDAYGLTRDFGKYRFVPDAPDRRAPNRWVTDQAIEWLADAGDGKLFLFAHYYDVHADYASEPHYERLFTTPYSGIVDGTGWQLMQVNLDDDYVEMCHRSFDPAKCRFGSIENPRVVDESVERLELDAADVRRLEELYDAGIRQLDTELSRLFGWLRTEGLLDETLLVITSDHGEEFMEHGHVDHFVPTYQEILRVPLVFRGPGIPAGVRVGAPVSSVDIAPTILGLAGVSERAPLDGLDLAPLWAGGAAANGQPGERARPFQDRYLYGEASGGLTYDFIVKGFYPIYRSVRKGRYKLVYESKGPSHALYDLETDPGERVDVSAREPEITALMVEEMRRRYADSAPEASPETPVELDAEDLDRLRALGYLK